MQIANTRDDWVELSGAIKPQDIRVLRNLGHIPKLSITKSPLLTVKTASAFSALKSVSHLWLWCDVTRTAMRHILAIPGLREIDVLAIVNPGKLGLFSSAESLEVFRGNHYLTEADLLAVTSCRTLREIGAQCSLLTPRVVEALLDLPELHTLDLEGTAFDDNMAASISNANQLVSLDIGNTRLTRKGLSHLCTMKQLRSLDIWATNITEPDLELLAQLPNLEYLSLGNMEGLPSFRAESLLPRLKTISSLQRVWLDGIALNTEQQTELESRYAKVTIT